MNMLHAIGQLTILELIMTYADGHFLSLNMKITSFSYKTGLLSHKGIPSRKLSKYRLLQLMNIEAMEGKQSYYLDLIAQEGSVPPFLGQRC